MENFSFVSLEEDTAEDKAAADEAFAQLFRSVPVYTEEERAEGVQALIRLLKSVRRNRTCHGTIPVQEFLASLYNDDFAPSMWSLSTRISEDDFQDVLRVMVLIRRTNQEPHYFIRDGSNIWMYEITTGLRRHRAVRKR